MPSADVHHALTPRRERATLLALAAVQFTHIVDFMIMMPLGSQLMRQFDITPAQFSHLVASYGLAAGVSGLAGGFILDRYDRKRALIALYSGFGLATLACGFAPTHLALLAARIAAGAFGGVSGSMVTAMVGDIIPIERRGRALSVVMSAFPIASVMGVPAGLMLAGHFGWHAAFIMLGACAAANVILAAVALPPIRTAVLTTNPFRQMREIVTHGVHLRAFALGGVLVMAGGCLVPFIAPSMIANMGLTDNQLPWAYAAGGACTFFSMPVVGRWSDRVDKFRLLVWMSVVAIVVMLVFTRLGPTPLVTVCVMMALFMVSMSSRYTPAMAMITNAVEARYRGGFMSVNASLQQAASAGANILAGAFVTTGAGGRLVGLPMLSYASGGFFLLTVLAAHQLRAAAPHVSAPVPFPTSHRPVAEVELPAA
ncbi:MFS transporter [Horticoccus luteus]|uniref:MFS transporter n=1 Tax=Horticoccus luteus TaxID=2862869 RepID=A0A8F9XK76_9BACT|nr:MFS transporter [Horticoccus luteus]QYM79418.1 MFS transporter [Horticoccus luteus]